MDADAKKAEERAVRVDLYTASFLLPRAKERSETVRKENYTIKIRPEHNQNTVWSDEHGEYQSKSADSKDLVADESIVQRKHRLVDSLTSENAARLRKLIDAANEQLRKPNVSTATLKRVFTKNQFVQLKESILEQREGTEVLYGNGCPEELRNYSRKVARADFLYGKAERMSAKREYSGHKYGFKVTEKAYSDAESAYESAIENLEELWSVKTPQEIFEIENWLDREVTWTFEKHPSLDPDGVPHARNSRSAYTLAYLPKLSKKLKREHCILDALIAAIDEVIYVYEDEVIDDEMLEVQSFKLKNCFIN